MGFYPLRGGHCQPARGPAGRLPLRPVRQHLARPHQVAGAARLAHQHVGGAAAGVAGALLGVQSARARPAQRRAPGQDARCGLRPRSGGQRRGRGLDPAGRRPARQVPGHAPRLAERPRRTGARPGRAPPASGGGRSPGRTSHAPAGPVRGVPGRGQRPHGPCSCAAYGQPGCGPRRGPGPPARRRPPRHGAGRRAVPPGRAPVPGGRDRHADCQARHASGFATFGTWDVVDREHMRSRSGDWR